MITVNGMEHCRAVIEESGAIVFENRVSIDGYHHAPLTHVVTHIHSDHTRGLRKAIRKRKTIIGTPITIEVLEALGYPLNKARTVKLGYGERLSLGEDAELILERTNHIPGSSMVVYQRGDTVFVYTSDFKMPGTYIVEEPDVMVIDATYGRSEWRRPWQEEIEVILVDIVLEGLSKGPVNIYAYNGKIQEVMQLLRSHGVTAPFITPLRPYVAAKIMKSHGISIGEVYYEYDLKAREILRDGWFVYFLETREWRRRRDYERRVNGRRPTHVLLTGWEFGDSFRRLSGREWIVSFSDHADFDQLVEYVELSKPKKLIVDASRAGSAAYEFAKYVSLHLNIPAIALPNK